MNSDKNTVFLERSNERMTIIISVLMLPVSSKQPLTTLFQSIIFYGITYLQLRQELCCIIKQQKKIVFLLVFLLFAFKVK